MNKLRERVYRKRSTQIRIRRGHRTGLHSDMAEEREIDIVIVGFVM